MRTWRFLASPFIKFFKKGAWSEGEGAWRYGDGGGSAGRFASKIRDDLEKGVPESEEQKRESQLLSSVSRTQSIPYWHEKVEREMQEPDFGSMDKGGRARMNGYAGHE